MRTRWEAGFTLVEVVIVSGIIAVMAGAVGTFFLAGATPAVASANRDVVAALDEARRTAIAFDAATVVFTPAVAGSGYSARIYERMPGDAAFRARNGPTYESTVAISEISVPLGAPGFAFTIDSHGSMTGLAHYTPSGSNYTTHACPASGTFVLRLAYARDERTVAIRCRLGASDATPVAFTTPAPGVTTTPYAAGTCPSLATCTLAVAPTPGSGAECPAGYSSDAVSPGLCDSTQPTASPTLPAASPTCPPGSPGQFPNCALVANPTPTPMPTQAPAPPLIARCTAGAADASGFASCIVSDPVEPLGPSITRTGCGTHTPIADPGPRFSVEVDVFRGGSPWAGYTVSLTTAKTLWMDVYVVPPAAICGLNYTLAISLAGVAPLSGNATVSPYVDTGDINLVDQGVEHILTAPQGQWGSNS